MQSRCNVISIDTMLAHPAGAIGLLIRPLLPCARPVDRCLSLYTRLARDHDSVCRESRSND